jgi:hypothetical protein
MTYGELKQQVATRLNRPDLLTAVPPSTVAIIPSMVADRIRFYQKALYAPSETLDYSITCIPGQSIYPFAPYPSLVNVQSVLNVRLLLGVWIPLTRAPWYEELLAVDVVNPPFQTLPAYWATYGETLRLYPTPGQPYPLELMVSAAPPEPVNDSATNFWTDKAATLLIEATCADICRLVLNDEARATQHQWATEREAKSLRDYTARLRGPFMIQPHL